MVQCFLVESNSLKSGSFFFFLLFCLSASQMIYTRKTLTMAINTDVEIWNFFFCCFCLI